MITRFLICLLVFAQYCYAQSSYRYHVPDWTVSPAGGLYGISVLAVRDLDTAVDDTNKVIWMQSGETLAVLPGAAGIQGAPNNRIDVTWTKAGNIVMRTTQGRWFATDLALVKLNRKKVVWKLDLLKRVQEEILGHTKTAVPEQFKLRDNPAASRPHGFYIGVTTSCDESGDLRFPLKVFGWLTDDIITSGLPENKPTRSPENLESKIEGQVDEDGKFTVTHFKVLQDGTESVPSPKSERVAEPAPTNPKSK